MLRLLPLLLVLFAVASPVRAETAAVLAAHERALATTSALFDGPVRVEQVEVEPAEGELLSFHWQAGRYREDYAWLGFREVFAYDGGEHWYGSDICLPYTLDDGRPPSITLELVRAFAYLRAPHRAHVGAPVHLPPLNLEGLYLLRFAPPKMHEALLLIEPDSLLLTAAVVGDAPKLADSRSYTALSFEDWRDFDGVPYPGTQRLASFDGAGVKVRERLRRVVGVGAVEPREQAQFTRAGAPEPRLFAGSADVPFDTLSGTPLVVCIGPDGEPLRMLVDTGASVGLLRRDTAERLGLTPLGTQDLGGHGGTARVGHVRMEGVTLGAVELPPFPAAVLLDTQPRGMESQLRFVGVDGILGNFLLAGGLISLDFGTRRLSLEPPGVGARFGSAAAQPASVLKLHRAQLPWVSVEVDGRIRGGAFVNSGGNYTFSLGVQAIDAAGMVYPVESLGRSVAVHGPLLAGVIRPGEVRIPALTGPSLTLLRPATQLDLPTPGEPYLRRRSASLGNGFLSGYAATFDLHGERLLLEPIR